MTHAFQMETRTIKIAKSLPALTLAAGLSALGLFATNHGKADNTVAWASLNVASGTSAQSRIAVLKTKKLYRFQQRPWLRIPEGVALHVRAPAGMTAADLHNALSYCAPEDKNQDSPLCVEGATLKVVRSGGTYVVRITSDSRAAAMQIQARASQK